MLSSLVPSILMTLLGLLSAMACCNDWYDKLGYVYRGVLFHSFDYSGWAWDAICFQTSQDIWQGAALQGPGFGRWDSLIDTLRLAFWLLWELDLGVATLQTPSCCLSSLLLLLSLL